MLSRDKNLCTVVSIFIYAHNYLETIPIKLYVVCSLPFYELINTPVFVVCLLDSVQLCINLVIVVRAWLMTTTNGVNRHATIHMWLQCGMLVYVGRKTPKTG